MTLLREIGSWWTTWTRKGRFCYLWMKRSRKWECSRSSWGKLMSSWNTTRPHSKGIKPFTLKRFNSRRYSSSSLGLNTISCKSRIRTHCWVARTHHERRWWSCRTALCLIWRTLIRDSWRNWKPNGSPKWDSAETKWKTISGESKNSNSLFSCWQKRAKTKRVNTER